MIHLWDFNKKDIQHTKSGKKLLLERAINYGTQGKKIIRLRDVKKYWHTLKLYPKQRKLFSLLIWGKYTSSPKTKKKSFLF